MEDDITEESTYPGHIQEFNQELRPGKSHALFPGRLLFSLVNPESEQVDSLRPSGPSVICIFEYFVLIRLRLYKLPQGLS